jgi:hypothetical protein
MGLDVPTLQPQALRTSASIWEKKEWLYYVNAPLLLLLSHLSHLSRPFLLPTALLLNGRETQFPDPILRSVLLGF